MSQPVMLKVYAGFRPASAGMRDELDKALANAIPPAFAALKGEILTISFEGIYFPLEETLAIIRQHAADETSGRLDVLDMENWILRRHELVAGTLVARERDLNTVLDYSGF